MTMDHKMVSGEGGEMRVLHVSDDSEVLRSTKTFLEQADYELRVISVRHPEGVFRLLSSEAFDCVVSDYRTPGVDGVELARRIRMESGIPIIIYTDRGSEGLAEAIFEAGVDSYVQRRANPGHLRVLEHRIRLLVEKRRAEELYRSVVERIRDPLRILVGATIVHANQEMADLFGVGGPGELIGRDAAEWIAEEDRERVRETALARQRGEEQPRLYEFNVRRADGGLRRVEASASLVSYMGRPASLSFLRDVTERKKTEEQVRQIQGYLQLLVNRMPIALIVWDTEFHVKTWNPSAARMFGFSEEEALGKHPYDLIVPRQAQPHIDEIWRRLMEGDETAHSVNENTTKDGRTIICDWTNTPLKRDDGTVIGVLSMTQDITERKRAEERVLYLSKLLDSIRKVNQLIIRERDRDSLLDGVCETLTEDNVYRRACIALMDKDEELVSTFSSGWGEEFNLFLELMRRGEHPRCVRETLRVSGLHLFSDPESECVGCPIADRYRDCSALAARIEYGGRGYGVLTVSAPRDRFMDEERALFREVAGDISYALNFLEVEAAKREAEAQVRELVYGLNRLAPGRCYLHTSHEAAYRTYADLALHGVPGLCLAREDPDGLVAEYSITPESIVLISSRPIARFKAVSDLQEVSRTISRFLSDHEEAVVLLDGLEYLVTRFGFDLVYQFIQEKRFDFLEARAVLLVPLDPATLADREMALLASEVNLIG